MAEQTLSSYGSKLQAPKKRRSKESRTKINRDKRERAKKLLGLPLATANYRLYKQVLFSVVVKLGENVCHRCSLAIESSDELSIEHKEDWLSAKYPAQVFFDLENIGFSHILCNTRAATQKRKIYISDLERERARDVRRLAKRVAAKKLRPRQTSITRVALFLIAIAGVAKSLDAGHLKRPGIVLVGWSPAARTMHLAPDGKAAVLHAAMTVFDPRKMHQFTRP